MHVWGLKRLDVDPHDLLGGVLLARGKGVDTLFLVEFAALELLSASILERHDRGDLRQNAIAPDLAGLVHAVHQLDIRQCAGLFEFKGDIHVLDGHDVILATPLKLERALALAAVVVLDAIEQRAVRTALNHLGDVSAVLILRKALVGDLDVEVILGELDPRPAGLLGQIAVLIGGKFNDIELRANQHRDVRQLDVCLLLGFQLEGGDGLRTVEQRLVTAIGKSDVDALLAVREVRHRHRQVLHTRNARGAGDGAVLKLEFVTHEIDNCSQRVGVASIARHHAHRDDIARRNVLLIGHNLDGTRNLATLLGAIVELRHGEGVVVHVIDAIVVEVGIMTGDLAVKRRCVRSAILNAKVILHVREVVLGNRGILLVGADLPHLGAVLLVYGQLTSGEEVSNRRQGSQAHVLCSRARRERVGLDLIVPSPIELDGLGPVVAIKRGLDAHLGNGAVRGVIAGVVLELVEHHGLAVVEHHGLAGGVCVGVEVRIVEAVVEGERLLEAAVITALPAGLNRLGSVAPRILEGRRFNRLGPLGVTLGIARANLIRVRRMVAKVGVGELGYVAD